jgi:hypothetical protein
MELHIQLWLYLHTIRQSTSPSSVPLIWAGLHNFTVGVGSNEIGNSQLMPFCTCAEEQGRVGRHAYIKAFISSLLLSAQLHHRVSTQPCRNLIQLRMKSSLLACPYISSFLFVFSCNKPLNYPSNKILNQANAAFNHQVCSKRWCGNYFCMFTVLGFF